MAFAHNGSVTLYYRDEGNGSPVLLIHGHTLDHRVFDGITPALTAAGLRVIRPDLRGHGSSSMPGEGYRFSDHAADMRAVLEAAGIEHASVAGFSLGGGIALEMALTMPQLIERMVLIDPVMPGRPFEPAFMDNIRQVARTARTGGIRAAMEGPWASSPLFAHSLSKPGVREKLAEIVRDFPGAEYLATRRDAPSHEWQVPDRLGEITAPVLVISGENDMPGFRAFAREAAEGIPGARLVAVPGCGHLVPLEDPETLARLIIEHVTAG
ncbi:MAG: alpha/beta hydrolase [Acidobacteria bacterium]|nr:alpha/beta hydrolase [Acidobacteriota bacterium]